MNGDLKLVGSIASFRDRHAPLRQLQRFGLVSFPALDERYDEQFQDLERLPGIRTVRDLRLTQELSGSVLRVGIPPLLERGPNGPC
jgi:hypothetical protein